MDRLSRERNMYNRLMKGGAPCLPFGAGAGGFLNGHLCMLKSDLNSYLGKLNTGCKPISGMLAAPPQKPLINRIVSGFETGHLDLLKIRQIHHTDLSLICEPLLAQWEKTGLIRRSGHRISLTLPGQFWQVNMAQALIDYFLDSTESAHGRNMDRQP